VPGDQSLVLVDFSALAEVIAQLASDSKDSVHAPLLALSQKSPTGEAAVAEQHIALLEVVPKSLQKSQFLRSQGILGPGNDHARAQAHDRQEAKDRKAVSRLLDELLRKGCLISSGVSSAKRGAVDDLNPSSAPKILGCDGLLGFANKVIVDVLKSFERQSSPSLAVGAVL
jgi:hypothetical protein